MSTTDDKQLENRIEYIANKYENVFRELAKAPDDPTKKDHWNDDASEKDKKESE